MNPNEINYCAGATSSSAHEQCQTIGMDVAPGWTASTSRCRGGSALLSVVPLCVYMCVSSFACATCCGQLLLQQLLRLHLPLFCSWLQVSQCAQIYRLDDHNTPTHICGKSATAALQCHEASQLYISFAVINLSYCCAALLLTLSLLLTISLLSLLLSLCLLWHSSSFSWGLTPTAASIDLYGSLISCVCVFKVTRIMPRLYHLVPKLAT